MRGIAQLSFVPVTDNERSKRCSRPLALRVAADDEFGAVRGFHFHPGPGPTSRFVRARLELPHDAFEPTRDRRSVQGDAIVGGVHELDERRWQQALSEVAPALAVRPLAQIDAFEVQ